MPITWGGKWQPRCGAQEKKQDELIDTLGHFRESYQLAPGQCVLIRPDGYVGAFFHGKQSNDIENYLSRFAIGIKDEY